MTKFIPVGGKEPPNPAPPMPVSKAPPPPPPPPVRQCCCHCKPADDG